MGTKIKGNPHNRINQSVSLTIPPARQTVPTRSGEACGGKASRGTTASPTRNWLGYSCSRRFTEVL